MKKCTKCFLVKDLDCFSKQAKGRFGVTSICKPCSSERGKSWHQKNIEKSRQTKRIYATANRQKLSAYGKAWRKENIGRTKNTASQWSLMNPEKKQASTALRRSQRLRATPAWASRDTILCFYKLAQEVTRTTGMRANVDHIVPLRSPLVCGLHCEANLSVVSEVVNKSKGNLWWPHMWGRDPELDC